MVATASECHHGNLRLTALVDDGHLEVVVAETLPLDEAAAATAYLAGGHARSKVVLMP